MDKYVIPSQHNLTIQDYLHAPFVELAIHPGFRIEVWEMVCKLVKLPAVEVNVAIRRWFGSDFNGSDLAEAMPEPTPDPITEDDISILNQPVTYTMSRDAICRCIRCNQAFHVINQER